MNFYLFMDALVSVLQSDLFYDYILPFICVAFVAAVPCFMRAMIRR